jgi:hypothetical protein
MPPTTSTPRFKRQPFTFKSGWQDSNLRPPAPKAGALTSCATPRWLWGQDSNLRISCLTGRRLTSLATPQQYKHQSREGDSNPIPDAAL